MPNQKKLKVHHSLNVHAECRSNEGVVINYLLATYTIFAVQITILYCLIYYTIYYIFEFKALTHSLAHISMFLDSIPRSLIASRWEIQYRLCLFHQSIAQGVCYVAHHR